MHYLQKSPNVPSGPNIIHLRCQELLGTMMSTQLNLGVLRAMLAVSVQQSIVTEPVSRLLEVLLYST